jgi:hypothetical protein
MNEFYYFLLHKKELKFLLLKKSAAMHTLKNDGNIYCNPLQFEKFAKRNVMECKTNPHTYFCRSTKYQHANW